MLVVWCIFLNVCAAILVSILFVVLKVSSKRPRVKIKPFYNTRRSLQFAKLLADQNAELKNN